MAVCRSQRTRWAIIAVVLVCAVIAIGVYGGRHTLGPGPKRDLSGRGQAVYNYYCYQCHGYAGDAKTLASTYLDPKPRDFTRVLPDSFSRAAMLAAVRDGRPGTAMVGFARVLDAREIEAVVAFVRQAFMTSTPSGGRYHTAENGWPRHERYALAFPFATGAIALDTPWEALDPAARAGKRLFMSACISCHDRARVSEAGAPWELRAVSYPRGGYVAGEDRGIDVMSGASPYALHDRAPSFPDLSEAQARGRRVYLQNCAFCHAADGTGRNWIGSFLEPRPRDLTRGRLAQLVARGRLEHVIREGLPGTAMPAWSRVLGDGQMKDLIAYLKRAFGRTEGANVADTDIKPKRKQLLQWRRIRRDG